MKTLSSTDSCPNNLMFWKVLQIPSLAMRSGVSPTSWCCTPSLGLKVICPSVGLYTPVITLKTVVFPAPLGPIKPTICPFCTAAFRPLQATTPPNFMVRLSILSIASLTPF